MDGMVYVRLQVDYMKQAIMHAFSEREIELKKMLEEELGREITSFNFEDEVRQQVYKLLPELVQGAVRKAMIDALYGDPIKSELELRVAQAVHRVFDHMTEE